MVALQTLLELWHSDEDSCGYHAGELVVAACEHVRPASELAAVAIFYPGLNIVDVPEDDRDLIAKSYRAYINRLDLRRRSSSLVDRVNGALGR